VKFTSEVRDATCQWDHSVICHPTEVTAPYNKPIWMDGMDGVIARPLEQLQLAIVSVVKGKGEPYSRRSVGGVLISIT